MKLSVSETARLTGVSVRTLHYYDEIGLLVPSETSAAGYRYYDDENIERMQQIIFFRELEFPLGEIGRILSQPDFDKKQALNAHRELLLLKHSHIGELIRLVDDTLEGRDHMNQDENMFTAYEEAKQKYTAEAKARWGASDAFKESNEKDSKRTKADTVEMMNKADAIFRAFAEFRGKAPDDPEVQALVRDWQAYISEYHYNCTDEILRGLGSMYTEDERFLKNIDRYGAGTAQFISDAIKVYIGT